MRVRADSATVSRDIAVPRPVSRQKSYKSRLDQASTSSASSCSSLAYLQEKIEEEEEAEESEMVRAGPSDGMEARAEASQARSNGEHWNKDGDEYDSDKDDEDEDVAQEPIASEIGPQLPGVFDVGYHNDETLPNSGIIVTVSPYEEDPASTSQDNLLLIQLRTREYQGNFDGFAEINRFQTIEEMHEFIVNNSESLAPSNTSSQKQDRYLDILLKEKSEDRFRRLVDTSKGTVRRVLARNEHILQKLFASASLESFPSPLGPKEVDDTAEEEDEEDETDPSEYIAEVEENMKRWYMIEMIGIWLRLITDVKSYREAIKKSVLKMRCGIENDRYEGIAVPLRYK